MDCDVSLNFQYNHECCTILLQTCRNRDENTMKNKVLIGTTKITNANKKTQLKYFGHKLREKFGKFNTQGIK